jgi:hypothetical protein
MVVVVERLMVVTIRSAVTLDEDVRGGVDLDLPDVVVNQQFGERSVFGEIAPGPAGDCFGIGDGSRMHTVSCICLPGLDRLINE